VFILKEISKMHATIIKMKPAILALQKYGKRKYRIHFQSGSNRVFCRTCNMSDQRDSDIVPTEQREASCVLHVACWRAFSLTKAQH